MIQIDMELNRVIIVYKANLLRASSNRTSKGKRSATSVSEHYSKVVDGVKEAVRRLGIRMQAFDRNKLTPSHRADLIVSVGGDGTFLATAHHAGNTPIVGVNFLPHRCVGFFCVADDKNFRKVLKDIVTDKLKQIAVPMLEVRIDGKRIKNMALNEVLFSSPSPAEMSRYTLHVGKVTEYQRSSGVWIAAGPGSTAAMASAGGRRQKIVSARLQYLVREPCPPPGSKYRLMHGILPGGTSVSVTSQMPDAFAYLDGPDTTHPIAYGSKLTVKAVPDALKIFL